MPGVYLGSCNAAESVHTVGFVLPIGSFPHMIYCMNLHVAAS